MSNSSMDKPTEHTVETAGHVRRSKRSKLAGCCKRFWWAWVIGVIVFLGIVAVIIIFAIIPKVAQDKVNDAALTLKALEIRDPTPNSFKLSMDSSIHTGHGIGSKARIEPMNAKLYIEDKDKPFMTIPVGEVKGAGDVPITQKDYPVEISDEAAMDEFVKALMDNSTLNYKLSGRSKLWLGKINTMINYNEDIEMKGLNKLTGMVIKKIDLLANQTDGSNMAGKVMIPNPTIVTVEMGDVGLKIAYDGEDQGIGRIPNLILTPGNNLYDFRATVEVNTKTIQIIGGSGKPLTVGSNGTSINGVKIPWLSKPLEAMAVDVPVELDH